MQRHRTHLHHFRLRPLLAAGASLAALAVAVRELAFAAERRNPPKGKFITAGGVRLHYIDTGGAGVPLVLLHGNGTSLSDWSISGVTEKAQGRYRVIAFDRPGFGYSDRPRGALWTPEAQAELIKAALDGIGVEIPVVVGHSWGSLVAAALAIKYPRFVRGLVLISGYYFPTMRADSLMFAPFSLPLAGDVMRYTVGPLIGLFMAPRFIRKVFAPHEVPARFARNYKLSFALRPWQLRASAAESTMMIPVTDAMQFNYPSIKVPTVIISGDEDKIVDVDRQSVRLHQAIAKSTLRLLPGLGHMVHYLAPNSVVGAIDSVAGGSQTLQSRWA